MRLTVLALLLPLALPVAHCSAAEPTKEEVEKYLLQISDSHKELYSTGENFGKSLGPLLQGNDPDILEVYRAYRQVAMKVAKVRRESKEWTVPDHPTARRLSVANEAFMDYQVKAALEWIPSLIEIMEDDTLSLKRRGEKVLESLEQGSAEENAVGEKVRDAYSRLAAEFDLE